MEQRLDIGVSISLSVQCVPTPPPFLFRILFFFHSLLLLGLYTLIQELLSHVPCLRNTARAVIGLNSNFFIKGLQGTMAIALYPDLWIRGTQAVSIHPTFFQKHTHTCTRSQTYIHICILRSVTLNRCFNLVKGN